MRVTVLALGDLGRSPRMQYHALALAGSGAEVDVVGYGGSAPLRALSEAARLHLLPAPSERRHGLSRPLFFAYTAIRLLRDFARLVRILFFSVKRPDVLLVQNPPAAPALSAARLAARLRGARLVIDWHNFGWRMLGLRLGERHPLVRLARAYERRAGRRADAHLCVSRAMKAELENRFGIAPVAVLYDRPAALFEPLPPEARGPFLDRLRRDLGLDGAWREGRRPVIIVSPTSWTADEDFGVLLGAAVRLDAAVAARREALPDLAFIATGKGPLRADFERRARQMELRHVHLRTAWFEPEDYPRLVGAADLGLSLHRSASGLDLAMKVADMFGAGLPVLALDYGPVLAEQLRPGEDGLLFRDAEGLTARLLEAIEGFPNAPLLDRLRAGARRAGAKRWSEGWVEEARWAFFPP
jgi:beta-1,4-mannosyltransferase